MDQRLPATSRFGLAVIAFGLLFDFVQHDLVPHTAETLVAGFPIGEHLAHFVVLLGMVLVIGGIVRHGIRAAGRMDRPAPVGRPFRPLSAATSRPERSPRNALR
jgi:uncharacterized membrane protein YidH (DUF202 family)